MGNDWLSKKLRVPRQTVSQWRHGKCYPKVSQMKKIKKVTKGLITYDIIIDTLAQPSSVPMKRVRRK